MGCRDGVVVSVESVTAFHQSIDRLSFFFLFLFSVFLALQIFDYSLLSFPCIQSSQRFFYFFFFVSLEEERLNGGDCATTSAESTAGKDEIRFRGNEGGNEEPDTHTDSLAAKTGRP